MRIAKKSLHINELRNAFAHEQGISVQDLIFFYSQFTEKVKRSTIDWKIFELTKEGVLHRISRGNYSLTETNIYLPEISRSLRLLYSAVLRLFPFVDLCVWNTKSINEFMLHQPGRFYTILEVEKDVMESVFYELNEKYKDVYLNPSDEILSKYVVNKKDPIIITNLITEAPTEKVDGVVTTTLEKILVDIYSDQRLFGAQQGAELERIYNSAFEKYTVNNTKLLRYANRRNKKNVIEQLINKILRNGSTL